MDKVDRLCLKWMLQILLLQKYCGWHSKIISCILLGLCLEIISQQNSIMTINRTVAMEKQMLSQGAQYFASKWMGHDSSRKFNAVNEND